MDGLENPTMSINIVENSAGEDWTEGASDPVHPFGVPVPHGTPWRSTLVMMAFAALVLLIAACGKSGSTASSSVTNPDPDVTVPSSIPAARSVGGIGDNAPLVVPQSQSQGVNGIAEHGVDEVAEGDHERKPA